MSEMIDLRDDTFETFVRNNRVVLVDFWAPWCMPCRLQGRMFDSNLKDLPQGARIAKINVDENQQTARRYNVMGIPQMYLFVEGKVEKGWTGVTPAETIFSEMRKYC